MQCGQRVALEVGLALLGKRAGMLGEPLTELADPERDDARERLAALIGVRRGRDRRRASARRP